MPMAPPGFRPTVDLVARVRGLFLGMAVGLDRAVADPVVSAGELALVEATLHALATSPLDLERMVGAWIRLADGAIHPDTRPAVEWLRQQRIPPGPGDVPSSSSILFRFLPVAVMASGSPENLVSGTYHLASLLSADPAALWSAVAVNVATARFLHGRRDFVPDALEALRANDAPEAVQAAIRRVPFEPESGLSDLDPRAPTDCMHLAAWFADREPRMAVAMDSIERRHPGTWLAPLAGALLGARDGDGAVRRVLGVAPPAEDRVARLIAPLLTGGAVP